jgi:hypothetical protein
MAFSSSFSCSRITGEATNGAPSNGTVRWKAISVVTSGDFGTTGGESVCIQCVNRKQLTFAKAEKDIGKVLKAPNGVPYTLKTYDPRRLSGVSVHREAERQFSNGDRVQFAAPSRELHVANRELGTVEHVNSTGNLRIRMDSGRKSDSTSASTRTLTMVTQ